MSIVLRPYQQKAVDEIRDQFRSGVMRVLLQLATGGGKTLTAGYILGNAAARANRSMFIVNRVELLDQTARAFDKLEIDYGLVAAGYTGNPRALVQIASIDTLKRRLHKVPLPKIVVWDECRALGAAGWTQVYSAFKGAAHLGLDATPVRLDGKGLGAYFEHMVQGPTYSELMALGALVPFTVYAPSCPDMSGVRTKMGDYDHAQTEDMMDRPTLVGDIVSHFQAHAGDKLGITFAVSRKHSEHLAAQYRAAGISAVHLDGDSDKAERKRVVDAFRRREIQMLTNVNLFSAGFDVPGVEVIVDAAPTQSLSMFLQRCGRGSRPEPEIGKKECLLFDHAGNTIDHKGRIKHGLPDQDREWQLDPPQKRKKKKDEDEEPSFPIRQCEKCYAIFPPAPICPVCGHEQSNGGRSIEQIEGELRIIDAETARSMVEQKKTEVRRARTLEQLQAIAGERGYGPGWASSVFNARKRASDTRAEAQYKAFAR